MINRTDIDKNGYSKTQLKEGHFNYMEGVSYDINNPIVALRVVTSSCFFGEPMYYAETSEENQKVRERVEERKVLNANKEKDISYLESVLGEYLNIPEYQSYSSAKLIEMTIDNALKFDAEATLQEAVRLRNEDNIRTTPQVIMVRAANNENVRGTGLINKYANQIMKRTDEAAVQLAYQIQVYGKPIPNALKKAWKRFLENKTEYDLAKYRMDSRKFKTIDVVNLVKAYSPEIDALMKGKLKLSEEDTWEALISKEGASKDTWEKAIPLMGHMALLRNLRNFTIHKVDENLYLKKLVETAKNGKQLPFRYFSAYHELTKNHSLNVSGKVLDAIEECLEISMGELPKFEGKVMSLCDNSGSATAATVSSMSQRTTAEIANLTAILTGKMSDDGYIGVFGDKLKTVPVRKNDSVFSQLNNANRLAEDIGAGTEGGVWLFFNKAINEKEHWDHIFVYSDMQAGHGQLYGQKAEDYEDFIWGDTQSGYAYIDVAKLVKTYREKVNPNVKVYLVQVAGYGDTLVPEYYKDTYILGGWGAGLLKFAHSMSCLTNDVKKRQNPKITDEEKSSDVKKSRVKK